MKKEVYICDICEKNMEAKELRCVIDFGIFHENSNGKSRFLKKPWEVCQQCKKSEFGIEDSTVENAFKLPFGFKKFFRMLGVK